MPLCPMSSWKPSKGRKPTEAADRYALLALVDLGTGEAQRRSPRNPHPRRGERSPLLRRVRMGNSHQGRDRKAGAARGPRVLRSEEGRRPGHDAPPDGDGPRPRCWRLAGDPQRPLRSHARGAGLDGGRAPSHGGPTTHGLPRQDPLGRNRSPAGPEAQDHPGPESVGVRTRPERSSSAEVAACGAGTGVLVWGVIPGPGSAS